MRLSLFINGKQADLSAGGSDALILWTYSREDVESPAAVRNSFTKTVTLPATEANNAIFSHLYREDHYSGAGTVFDPLDRNPFVIIAENGTIVERGYIKVDKMQRRGAVPVSYEVTMYGGIGDLMYRLMYRDDGRKRTLRDMRWLTDISQQPDPRDLEDPHDLNAPCPWSELLNGNYLSDSRGGLADIPVNSGIPEKEFDASKAYYKPGTYYSDQLDGIVTSVVQDGVSYGPHPQANGGVILNLGTRVTQWEAQCFAPSELKSVIHVARVLLSIQEGTYAGDFGEWRLQLYGSWWSSTNPNWWKVWMTIPSTDNQQTLDTCLTGTMSPAELLLGYAKMFGLVFHPDPTDKIIYLMTREEYFAGFAQDWQGLEASIIDLSDRIDAKDVKTQPFIMDARVYDFSVPTAGAFAAVHQNRYGRVYGSFLLDTRYSFDAAVCEVMRSLPFNGCADVKEPSAWFFTNPDTVSEAPPMGNYLKFSEYSEVTYLLYNYNASKNIKMTVPPSRQHMQQYTIPALPQFHDAAGKPTKSDNVLLYFLGGYHLPAGSTASPVRWHVGVYKDNIASSNLTGGKSIWNISPTVGVTPVTDFPWFRRWWDTQPGEQSQWPYSLDFGDPFEHATGDDNIPGDNVFSLRWEAYLSDRFNRDTVHMTVRVDLSGLQVDAGLLRRFFYYRGAYWSLNKIVDYAPGRTGVLTTCEFVRVNDISAYTGITQ